MSVLVKGMKMPANCGECPMICDDDLCRITKGGRTIKDRPPHCPLVSVPPHGRLIDADALSEKMVICSKHFPKDSFEWDMCGEVITQVALAPTIIEAEGGEI